MAAEFILIDLQTQMPYLPAYMRTWSRNRLLDWLANMVRFTSRQGTRNTIRFARGSGAGRILS
jgi:hypothetical protein